MITLLKSKISCRVADCNIDYEGSITIPKDLMTKAGIYQYEQVHVLNKRNGERAITYAMEGSEVCLNGALAILGDIDDKIIILAYRTVNMIGDSGAEWGTWQPKIVKEKDD